MSPVVVQKQSRTHRQPNQSKPNNRFSNLHSIGHREETKDYFDKKIEIKQTLQHNQKNIDSMFRSDKKSCLDDRKDYETLIIAQSKPPARNNKMQHMST
jgi:hypothetical protein